MSTRFEKVFAISLATALFCAIQGCGNSNKATLPTDALTEEQKAAIKAEDDRVNDEESQGSFGKSKAKKK